MKILKLSTNAGGGATTAAERQAKALRQIGHTVQHMYVRQDWGCDKTTIAKEGENIFISSPMHEFLKTDLLFQNFLHENRTDISNTYMSLWRKATPFDEILIEFIKKERFDIVHCHWTSNLVSSKLFNELKKNKIKVVITGHDMNHFTGACHYDAGCHGFSEGCTDCYQIQSDNTGLIAASMEEKEYVYSSLKPRFIFPCHWMNTEYLSSSIGRLLGSNNSKVIRNCIDTDFFSPIELPQINRLRQSYGFTEDELLIVSGAENNHEIRKGFNYFEQAFKALNRSLFGSSFNKKITFVAFGGGDHKLKSTHPNVNYRHLGILAENQVRDLFQIADLLAFTSIEENFANVILESLMCGCPVLGFKIGGIPDIVSSGTNGMLVDEIDGGNFSSALIDLVTNNKLKKLKTSTIAWHHQSFMNYSYSSIAKELEGFYRETLEGADANE